MSPGASAGRFDEDREAKLTQAFVTLADTLVAEFEVIDVLQTLVEICTEVLDVTAAGMLLRSETGEVQSVASTTGEVKFVELVQLGTDAGPCAECLESGHSVTVPDIDAMREQWPQFAEAATTRGFRSVQAAPMRLRGEVIGSINLFHTEVGALNDRDVATAQALSDVATIAILTERGFREKAVVNDQLQHALKSRIRIEQAKGVLAQSGGLTIEDAFDVLRRFARANSLKLLTVATGVVDGSIPPRRVLRATDR